MDARVIEGYRLTRRLDVGHDDMFEAVRDAEPRKVAIELVVEAQRSAEAYWHDARVAASSRHPAIVELHGYGRLETGECYTIYEWLDGVTLAAMIEQGPLPPSRLRSVFEPLYGAVSAAHARGVVHGGIWPGAVGFGARGVKLIGFGGWRVIAVRGILHVMPYMAPEELHDPGDERSDVYRLAATVWAAVVGHPPRAASSVAEAAAALQTTPIGSARARRREVSPSLDAVLLRALAHDPTGRPSSVEEAWRELSSALAG